jgi:hypothetical protein
MNPAIQISLALILCLPTFAILGALYCVYPKSPAGARRRIIDLAVILIATVLSVVAMRWGFRSATGVGGALWKQVLATLLAYGAFLGVLSAGWLVRAGLPRLMRSVSTRTAGVA